MNRLLPVIASAVTLLSIAPAFSADGPSAEEIVAQANTTQVKVDGGPGAHERLNLSDAQLEQLRALKDKFFAANAPKKAQLQVLRNQLRSEMTKENIDKSAVLSVQSQINELQADLANSRIAQMIDAQQVFTPEQRKLMHSRMLHHGFRGGFGRHHRGGHGGSGCGPGGCGGHGGKFGGHGKLGAEQASDAVAIQPVQPQQ